MDKADSISATDYHASCSEKMVKPTKRKDIYGKFQINSDRVVQYSYL